MCYPTLRFATVVPPVAPTGSVLSRLFDTLKSYRKRRRDDGGGAVGDVLPDHHFATVVPPVAPTGSVLARLVDTLRSCRRRRRDDGRDDGGAVASHRLTRRAPAAPNRPASDRNPLHTPMGLHSAYCVKLKCHYAAFRRAKLKVAVTPQHLDPQPPKQQSTTACDVPIHPTDALPNSRPR